MRIDVGLVVERPGVGRRALIELSVRSVSVGTVPLTLVRRPIADARRAGSWTRGDRATSYTHSAIERGLLVVPISIFKTLQSAFAYAAVVGLKVKQGCAVMLGVVPTVRWCAWLCGPGTSSGICTHIIGTPDLIAAGPTLKARGVAIDVPRTITLTVRRFFFTGPLYFEIAPTMPLPHAMVVEIEAAASAQERGGKD